ncbi:MAG: S-layer homology domain-containing protein [Candidatus Gracilibacteria bacterium]|jgi:hypothetical protein|nr:S-layer homology domain-containing protein [Candidatus Gracilibacteria bacterium]
MKKLLFLFLFFGLSASVFGASFNDVSSTHKNFNAIEYLKSAGIVNGFSDGTFRPENKLNRAEAVKIITEAFDISSASYSGEFSDVKSGDWFANYVASVKREGIVNGYSDGTFKPGNTLILAEALKIVLVGGKASVPASVDKDVFSDVRASEWYSVYAYFARENNIILGDDYGKISPAGEISRGEFAELIFRMMKVKENGKAFDLSTSWPVYLSELGFSMKYNAPRWKVSADKSSVTFYNPDLAYGELSASKVFSNSARIIISVDLNTAKKSASDYFSTLKSNFPNYGATEFQFKNMSALELSNPSSRMVDWYIYTSGGAVIGAFTEYGSGILAFQYPREISAMLSSIEAGTAGGTSGGSSKEQILSGIYSNILIENKGMSSLNLLPDKSIIETDTIGVGTGAVDYYYCSEFDVTFKYERASDLILDKREGKTSAF